MKTPRQAFKENFWIGAKGGLLDRKHVNAMGDAVWLFLFLLRAQTGIDEWGEGIVNYGHPQTLETVSLDFGGVSKRTLQRWIAVLKRTGYIDTESHSNHGLTFHIAKAKQKTRKPQAVRSEQRASKTPASVKTPHADCVPSLENSIREPRTEFQNSIRDSVKESLQAAENAPLAAPIPKGFIPKSLSYYNTESAAQNAASLSSLFRKTARELQPQENPPYRERQRLLDGQSKTILDKYAPGWRKEATA